MKETNKLHQQSESSKKRLLEAAHALFYEHGFANVSVSDICRQAGMTKGAFYYHFDSKDAVYRQLFTPNLDADLAENYRLPEGASCRERLLLLSQRTFLSSRALGRELMAQDLIRLLTTKTSNLYDKERIHTRLLTEAYEQGQKEGALPEGLTCDAFIMLYACLMNGFLIKWASASPEDDARVDWDALLAAEFSLIGMGQREA